MAVAARLYTPTEAAIVSGVAIKAVHNAIDKRIIKAAAKPSRGGRRSTKRALTADDVLRLKLWYKVGDVLSQERRKRLFRAISEQPSASTVKADDLLIIDVAEARKQIADKTRDLEAAEAMVMVGKDIMGGQPVFKGTRIPVRLISAMLADGADEDEILEGYPKLNRRQLTLAQIWTAAHPRRGRPKSLKERGLEVKSAKRVPLKSDPRPSRGSTSA